MIGNSQATWGWPAKALHWVGAALILLLLGHGWWMTHMAARPDRLAHYAGHAGLGYDLLALLILRLLWRWTHAVPDLPHDIKRWECVAARAGHMGLYVLMFASSVAGWALAGTFRDPLNKDAFGVPVPLIFVSQDRSAHGLLENSHKVLSYLLAALIVVHILGALRHQFVKHNDVLRRMWFAQRPSRNSLRPRPEETS
jgi:cytochrome b561